LIFVQDPALLTRTSESLCPAFGADDLIRPLLRRDTVEDLADVQYVWVCTVAADRFAVHPSYVNSSAVVMRVWQATCIPIAGGYEWPIGDPRQEVVAFLEGIDADPVFFRYGL